MMSQYKGLFVFIDGCGRICISREITCALRFSNRRCPLLHLQRELEARSTSAAITQHGTPAVPCVFDAYRSNIIAPDHLLSGLSKDILNAVFNSFPTDSHRREADASLCAALRENDLLRQKEVFNTRTKTIHSMTLSELFCVLLVSVPIMRMRCKALGEPHALKNCVDLLCDLQRLIALTYWWPEKHVDGKGAVELVQGDKEEYSSDLRTLAKEYVRSVDDASTSLPDIKRYLDKPNLHRLLELYEHTIPAFGHVREVTELVFESAHQPLKRCIQRSNNHKSHMFAVEHCVANDWQGRLSAPRQMLQEADNNESRTRRASAQAFINSLAVRRGIRRIMVGEQANFLHEERDKILITAIDGALAKQFKKAVTMTFEKDSMISNFAAAKTSVWKGRVKVKLDDLSRSLSIPEGTLKRIVDLSKRWINAVLPNFMNEHGKEETITLYRYARRVKVGETNRQIGNPMGFDTVYWDCVVQVYLDPFNAKKKIITPANSTTTSRLFFYVVVAVLERKEELPLAICYRCVRRGETLRREALDVDFFQLLILSSNVRRVGTYHACDLDASNNSECVIDTKMKTVKHNSTVMTGARIYTQCRADAYPPRMS